MSSALMLTRGSHPTHLAQIRDCGGSVLLALQLVPRQRQGRPWHDKPHIRSDSRSRGKALAVPQQQMGLLRFVTILRE
jgi:hypothetical protein